MSAPSVEDIDLDDIPVTDSARDSAESDSDPWPTCEVCGDRLSSTPTGRRPKQNQAHPRCTKHKLSKVASTGGRIGSGSHGRIAEGVAALYGVAGYGVGALYMIPPSNEVWLKDRDVIHAQASNLGEAWAKVCDTNPRVRKQVLEFLDRAGTFSLIAAHVPLVAAIALNHVTAQKEAEAAQEPQPQFYAVPPFAEGG